MSSFQIENSTVHKSLENVFIAFTLIAIKISPISLIFIQISLNLIKLWASISANKNATIAAINEQSQKKIKENNSIIKTFVFCTFCLFTIRIIYVYTTLLNDCTALFHSILHNPAVKFLFSMCSCSKFYQWGIVKYWTITENVQGA